MLCYWTELSCGQFDTWVLQKIFGEFVTVEMAFHAKALEIYTTAYQHIQNVDEEADLEVSLLIQWCILLYRIKGKDLTW